MKKRFVFMIAALVIGFSGVLNAQDSKKKVEPVDPVGKWDFQAAEAPYGYEKGQFVISKGEKGLKVKIVFNEYTQMDAYKVKYADNKISFTIYVEDESVYMSGTFIKDAFDGKASTTEGDIVIKAQRQKKKVEKR